MITIRTIHESEAGELLALKHALDEETKFMLLEPDERTATAEDTRRQIGTVLQRNNATILVAETEGQLIGYVSADGGGFRRNWATAHVVIGIRQAWTGQHVGSRLFAALDEWARASGIHRLELTVMVHNERGIALYQKMGFLVEGTMKDDLCVDGKWVSQYFMAKIIEAETR
jgi:RimJ/RimL family protein N-acetyltransferase